MRGDGCWRRGVNDDAEGLGSARRGRPSASATMRIGFVVGLAAVWVQSACNVRDAMSTDVEVVAEAGAHELRVDELVEMIAPTNVPLTRAAAEQWVQLWIDYSLFAQRVAAGDSLVDTLAVATAMWYDVDSVLVGQLRARLMDSLVHVDEAAIDSVFTAGEHRLVDLVVVQVANDARPDERARRRLAITRLRARVDGGTPFDQVTADLDPAAGAVGRRLLVSRTGLPKALADTVFALGVGELSGVIETPGAFYIVRRPQLIEAGGDFAEALRDTLGQRTEVAYLDALLDVWNVTVRSRAPALVREAVRYPKHTAASQEVLGTFRGRAFTVADFVRWLPVLRMQDQIVEATDEQLRDLMQSLIQNEILFLEARQRGLVLEPSDFQDLKDRLAKEIEEVQDALGLDVLLGAVTTREMLRRMVQLAVARHVSDVLSGERQLAVVPQALVEMLRGSARWSVSYAAIDRAVEGARTARTQLAWSGRAIRPPLPVSESGSEVRVDDR